MIQMNRTPRLILAMTCWWAFAGIVLAQTPVGEPWWPSPWGPEDQRGAVNRITPQKIRQAMQLIQEGRIYQLGRVYEHGMPLPGKRHFSLTIPGSPTAKATGKNRIVSHDEMFSGELGQVGTQFDGLGHVGVHLSDDSYFYNGFKVSEFGDAYGLKKLGCRKRRRNPDPRCVVGCGCYQRGEAFASRLPHNRDRSGRHLESAKHAD